MSAKGKNELSPGAKFRQLLKEDTVAMPGVFNAITALSARQAGFEALYLSGAGVTNSLTGYPDIALLTLTEMTQQSRYVTRAVDLPVIADADTGYGELHNVMRAIEEFEHAGLAGIHLEDQLAPKRCGHLSGKQIIEPAEMDKKIRAAAKARANPDFYLIARTDARSVNGIEDAINRAKRYMDAGADAIFPEALKSRDEFERFAVEVRAPLLANMTEFGQTPYLTLDEFRELGYAMVIFPMTAFRVLMKSAEQVYQELKRAGSQSALLDKMQTRQELYKLVRYAEYERLDREIAENCADELLDKY